MNDITNDMKIAERLALDVKKAGGCAYFVGGCVRDKLLGIPCGDLDIEVHGILPEALERILDTLGHTRTVGLSFGIWSLDHTNIDVAMPRTEKATGKGHRDFKTFTDPYLPVELAAQRRDFTINAIMENVLTHELTDCFGGVEDLRRGMIRHVNDQSFAEDPLRVLRGAGFAARFGFKLADETAALFKKMPLGELSRERVFAELEKALLKAERPSVFFDVLRGTDQLDAWFSEIKALIGVEQSPVYHAEGDVYNHTMLVLDRAAELRSAAKEPLYFMLAALCHDFGKAVTTSVVDGKIHAYMHENEGLPIVHDFISRLTSERALSRYVLNMVKLHMRPNMLAGQNAGQKAYFKLFDEAIEPHDLLLLAKADFYGSVSDSKADYNETEEKLLFELNEYEKLMKKPHVTGADLIAAGLKPGEDFSKLLELARKLRLAGIDKDATLAQVLAEVRKE